MQRKDVNGPTALQVTKLCDLSSTDPADTVCSVSWSQRGTYLSVGTNKGDTQLWDAHKVKMIRNLGVSVGSSKGFVHMQQRLLMVNKLPMVGSATGRDIHSKSRVCRSCLLRVPVR